MILRELNTLFDNLSIPVETGIFSDTPPKEYVVLTPVTDVFQVFADNVPLFEVREVRISVYCKGNYLNLKKRIVAALLHEDFTITEKKFIEREDDTGYYHYSIDVEKHYKFEMEENT